MAVKLPAVFAALLLSVIAPAVAEDATVTTSDPAQAEIMTSDVDHFWQAFDDAAKAPMQQREAVYQNEYIGLASQGLKDFLVFRHLDAAKLSRHVEENRTYYQQVRPYIGEVVGQKTAIQAAFRRLKSLYPDIKFPRHVYFVVGAQHGAGMNSPNGIIFSAEMIATPPGTPYSYIAVSPAFTTFGVVHETIHFNQAYQTGDKSNLLQSVVSEGTADFIASLVVQEPEVRQLTDRWQYGCPREAELAARFAAEADKTDLAPWLFVHPTANGWPPDMGYWLGYRIDQALYAQAQDKTAALRAMLQVTDFKAYFKASGYPTTATACVPEKPLT
jgi:hypothetical protein